MPDYDTRVYNKAVRELRGVQWDGCPYDIIEEMTNLMERYFLLHTRDAIRHAVGWAVSDELGGGCEVESL